MCVPVFHANCSAVEDEYSINLRLCYVPARHEAAGNETSNILDLGDSGDRQDNWKSPYAGCGVMPSRTPQEKTQSAVPELLQGPVQDRDVRAMRCLYVILETYDVTANVLPLQQCKRDRYIAPSLPDSRQDLLMCSCT
jgi:hypothetical protein